MTSERKKIIITGIGSDDGEPSNFKELKPIFTDKKVCNCIFCNKT